MKVVFNSIIGLIIIMLISQFYILPYFLKQIEVDNLIRLTIIKRLINNDVNKTRIFVQNEIETRVKILQADNNQLIGFHGLMDILKHSPKDRICNSSIIRADKTSKIIKYCK